jgi:hypothetical protein
MKAKSFVAYALTACAVPLAPALAHNADPSGPQGTGWYGAPNAAVPIPQIVSPHYEQAPYTQPHARTLPAPQAGTNADALIDDERMRERSDMRRRGGRWVYQGPSFDTNPPAPPS